MLVKNPDAKAREKFIVRKLDSLDAKKAELNLASNNDYEGLTQLILQRS